MTNNARAFQEYRTPPDLFAALDAEFGFTVDAAASEENALCPRFFTEETDGLAQSWIGETVFVNPPYARWQLFRWIEKAAQEAKHATVVMLVPTSVETEWFHDHCWDVDTQAPRKGVEVRFLKGRPRFIDPRDKAKSYKGWRPLTAVMVLVFRSVLSSRETTDSPPAEHPDPLNAKLDSLHAQAYTARPTTEGTSE